MCFLSGTCCASGVLLWILSSTLDYPERLVTGRHRDEARLVLSNSVLAIEVTIYSDCETPVLKARLLQTLKFHLREKKC
uniref:Putative secreted protein n=1 Tax=Ixodes ricinus TaxID=34613 RepID=A0A6B0TVB4_IXORI